MQKYALYELLPGVYYSLFKDHYTFAMTFLRSCEVTKQGKFRDKPFNVLEYMEWYAKKHGNGAFTYPKDWVGFHVDSAYIMARKAVPIPDYNIYDQTMDDIVNRVVAHQGSTTTKWSLIGTSKTNEKSVYRHELAHAFWDTSRAYRQDAKALVEGLPEKVRVTAQDALKDMGYISQFYATEIAAYAATGLNDALRETGLGRHVAPFKALFQSFEQSVTRRAIP